MEIEIVKKFTRCEDRTKTSTQFSLKHNFLSISHDDLRKASK